MDKHLSQYLSYFMKRFLDLTVCIFALIAFAIPMALIAFAVKLTSKGSVLYWSDRVGRGNRIFRMAKFRSMRTHVPQVATHLLENPESYLTPIGGFLRRTSLDELPQLISVLGGDLSLVGPRPALFNQDDLVGLRTEYGIQLLMPGLTGWAQVNGRDELSIPAKVQFDLEYKKRQSFRFDLMIIVLTVFKVLRSEGVRH
jgi:O-antigen biosynthesis protein WbqP